MKALDDCTVTTYVYSYMKMYISLYFKLYIQKTFEILETEIVKNNHLYVCVNIFLKAVPL